MDKTLGQEYTGENRVQFLKDNCEKIEQKGYMKRFSPEEIDVMKSELTEISIEINDIETAKKNANKGFKDQLDPLVEQKVELVQNLKKKAVFKEEDCFKFSDFSTKEIGYYNSDGLLVDVRPMRPEEHQPNLFKIGMTGTYN